MFWEKVLGSILLIGTLTANYAGESGLSQEMLNDIKRF
jgi:hypothetical protein